MSLSAVLTFYVSAGAVSSVVALRQAFEAKIVVSAESCSFVDQHFLENVTILEAVARIGIAGETLWSCYLFLNPVRQHSRSTISTATRLTIAGLLPMVNIRSGFVYGFSGHGKSNSTILFCSDSDINPFVEIP